MTDLEYVDKLRPGESCFVVRFELQIFLQPLLYPKLTDAVA